MQRRDFLKVMGLGVTTPSLLLSKTDSPPKRQNPDVISTGFPTIDDALGGGFKRGSLVGFIGFNHRRYQSDLLLQSIALNAATCLNKPSSVVIFTEKPRCSTSESHLKFNGLIEYNNELDLASFKNYDLVIVTKDCLPTKVFPQLNDLSTILHRLSLENNNVVLCHHSISAIYENSKYLFCGKSHYLSSSILQLTSHEFPKLSLVKNRYGGFPTIALTRPSVHFYQEANYVHS